MFVYNSHDSLQALPQAGIPLNQKWSNSRLLFLFLACSAAMYAQFGLKFPDDYWTLAACVGTYFLFSGVVTALDYFVVKESSFVVRDPKGDIFVGFQMRKGESKATLTFRQGQRKSESKIEIEKLFDTEGTLLQTPTLNMFTQSLASFSSTKESKKTN